MIYKQYLTHAFFITSIGALLLLPSLLASCSQQQISANTSPPPSVSNAPQQQQSGAPPEPESIVNMTATVPVKAEVLAANNVKIPVRGRLSLHLEVTNRSLADRTVDIKGLNMVYFDLPQAKISNLEASKKQGTLGIEMTANAQMQYNGADEILTIDSLPVSAHFPQLDDIFPPEDQPTNSPANFQEQDSETNEDKDNYIPSLQPGTMRLSLKLSRPLNDIVGSLAEGKKNNVDAELIWTEINIKNLEKTGSQVPGYLMKVNDKELSLQVAGNSRYKLVKKLCLQPVSIRETPTDPDPTGSGFDFGLPEAAMQWGKGDVVFDVRGWKTFTRDLKIPGNKDAEREVLNLVDEGDCVEVFMVQHFRLFNLHGGGFANGGVGTAAAKIIIADNGCTRSNPLLLAHELGHVLGLDHPGTGNINTLMCPSGCLAVNSPVNTRENIQRIKNPLITFELAERLSLPTLGPDECNSSNECGRCG